MRTTPGTATPAADARPTFWSQVHAQRAERVRLSTRAGDRFSPERERRRQTRVPLSVPALIRLHDSRRSYGWLRNLSPGGCMVRCPCFVRPGTEVALELYASAFPAFTLTAGVVDVVSRRDPRALRLSLEFLTPKEEAVDAISRILAAARRRHADPRDSGAILLTDPSLSYDNLEDDIARLGCYPIVVHSPLDVVAWLEDSATRIDTVMVSADPPRLDAFQLFDFLATEYPLIRRVLFAETPMPGGLWGGFLSGRFDVALRLPVAIADLAQALGISPEGIEPYCG